MSALSKTCTVPKQELRSSCVIRHLPSKVVFRQRSSFLKGRLPSKVVFHQRSSSVKGHLPSKVIFRQRSSFVRGHLLSKDVFCLRSSSVQLPPSCPRATPRSESSNYKLGRLDKKNYKTLKNLPNHQRGIVMTDGGQPLTEDDL